LISSSAVTASSGWAFCPFRSMAALVVGGGQKLSHYRGQFEPPASLPSEFFARPVIGLTRP
jgi:hypothetical protein